MKSIIFSLDGRGQLIDDIISFYNVNSSTEGLLTHNNITIGHFSDNEINTQYQDTVRGNRVYLVCSPTNSDLIMTLNLAMDAAKRASAKEIIPILPYYPYGRQEKKDVRGPIGAKVISEMLEHRGATSVILLDLHADQIQGFFNIPVTHMEGKYLFANYVVELMNQLSDNVVLASPDAGGTKRVKYLKDRINKKYGKNISYVTIDKTRKEANIVDEMILIGDVNSKHVIIVDDIIDTFGSCAKASKLILDHGALSVRVIATHGVLSGPAYTRIKDSMIDEVIISNSIEIPKTVVIDNEEIETSKFITVLSIADQISRAIIGIDNNKSVEYLKAE